MRSPRFSHISGDRMLDLVNTVEWRLGGTDREEDLVSYDDVLAWCEESEILTPSEAATLSSRAREDSETAAHERDLIVSARESVYAALLHRDAAAAEVVAEFHRESLARAGLTLAGSGWTWLDVQVALETPRDRIARGLIDLLRRPDLERLHQCEDAVCGWVYLDTSPRRNRRWCVTKDCGDRNRSRAYYARQKARTALS